MQCSPSAKFFKQQTGTVVGDLVSIYMREYGAECNSQSINKAFSISRIKSKKQIIHIRIESLKATTTSQQRLRVWFFLVGELIGVHVLDDTQFDIHTCIRFLCFIAFDMILFLLMPGRLFFERNQPRVYKSADAKCIQYYVLSGHVRCICVCVYVLASFYTILRISNAI